MSKLKEVGIWGIPLFALIVGLVTAQCGLPSEAAITLAITLVTAGWWMTEALPIPAASLVPIALLPLLGILPAKTAVAQSYGHPLILGGFLLSKAMEKSGVHRRLALSMVRVCGSGGGKCTSFANRLKPSAYMKCSALQTANMFSNTARLLTGHL